MLACCSDLLCVPADALSDGAVQLSADPLHEGVKRGRGQDGVQLAEVPAQLVPYGVAAGEETSVGTRFASNFARYGRASLLWIAP